jgi:hypothetical protein
MLQSQSGFFGASESRSFSAAFDISQNRQRKEEQEQRLAREKQLAAYAEEHKLQLLFDELADVLRRGAPRSDSEAEELIHQHLINKRTARLRSAERFSFQRSCHVQFSATRSITLNIGTVANVRLVSGSRGIKIDVVLVLLPEQLGDFLILIKDFGAHALDSSDNSFVVQLDGSRLVYVPVTKETSALADSMFSQLMILRQQQHHANVFQPL